MMKFIADRKGRKLIGFGLSDGNLEKLRQGMPILVKLQDMHPDLDFEVVIFWGKTEIDMQNDMARYGLIGDETRITIDPRLLDPNIPTEQPPHAQ